MDFLLGFLIGFFAFPVGACLVKWGQVYLIPARLIKRHNIYKK